MVNFAMLPPEVNSGLMYSGPGSGPMLAAAAAWEGLATELSGTAASYGSVISGLTSGPWVGPSSVAMADAAAPHLVWLTGVAGQAEEAGAQAAAAAGAYEAAFAATVPPPVIAANRALLMALLATNFLGQNIPAIAATEAEYAEMWAQDAGAMYGYAGASAAASMLTPFTEPAPTTNPGGLGAQAAAVSQAASSSAAADTLQLSQLNSTLPTLLSELGLGTYDNDLMQVLGVTGHHWNDTGTGLVVGGIEGDLLNAMTGQSSVDFGTPVDLFLNNTGSIKNAANTASFISGWAKDADKLISSAAKATAGAASEAAKALPAAIPSAIPAAGLGGIAGAVGKAASVGGLAVPASWTAAAPAVSSPATALQVSTIGAAAAAEPSTNTLGGLPMMAGAGRGMSGFAGPRYGFKLTVMPTPPAAG